VNQIRSNGYEYEILDVPDFPILEKIEKYANLPLGWHHGEGIPPQMKEIELAKEIVQFARNKFLSVDSVPGYSGGIQLAIYDENTKHKNYLEIDFEPSNIFNVTKYHCIDNTWIIAEDNQIDSINGIKSKIDNFWEEILKCRDLSEYYQNTITTQVLEGSLVKHLKIIEEASRLFKNIASPGKTLQYAAT